MRFPVVAVVLMLPLGCSSKSVNEGSGGSPATGGGGTPATGGGGTPATGGGGTPATGGGGVAGTGVAGGGGVGVCDAGTANCPPTTETGCKTIIPCMSCVFTAGDCTSKYFACASNNSCACHFACIRECMKTADAGSASVDACASGCGAAEAKEAFVCAMNDSCCSPLL